MATPGLESTPDIAVSGPKTVLVVDDEDSIRQLITVMLELEGYRVLEADCGEKALEIAAAEHVDLITLDVMMPGIDGWQVADELDRDDRTAVIPRVMVSGVTTQQLTSAPGAARASAVLTKPFDFVEFIDITQKLLAAPVPVPAPRNGEALTG